MQPDIQTPLITQETAPYSTKKTIRKAGRTLLVKSFNNAPILDTTFNSLVGLQNKTETKSSCSYFLTFDTIENAVDAFKTLRADSADIRVKFSYYRIFFTINGLSDTIDYNQTKQTFTTWIAEKTGTDVLFCKFYRKNNQYIGCGDLTLDTLDGMNLLLSKERGFKDYTLGSFTGSFFRYNGKKEKTSESQHV